MTKDAIKRIVEETIHELLGCEMIKYSDMIIYEKMNERLREHFKNPDPAISLALEELKDAPYISIIEDYYKNGFTLEAIANDLDVEVRTVSRQKKSLCIKIYKMIEEM